MNRSKNPKSGSHVLPAMDPASGSIRGNVMVYLIVVILIFGVLGVTIVSLFTTATTSSATPNNARRAAYVTESAIRYAFSELRDTGFDTGVVNTLNTRTYTVNSTGSFTLNIFSPWFVAAETYSEDSGGTLTLNVPAGKLTADWMAKDPYDIRVINCDYVDIAYYRKAWSVVDSWTQINDTTLTLDLRNQFAINAGERLCFHVRPTTEQTITAGGYLLVEESARNLFPEYNGAIIIDRKHYVYEQLIHEPANNRVKLQNITAGAMPNVEPAFPLTVTTTTATGTGTLIAEYQGDHIALSPRNFIVIPTGTADTVSVAGILDRAVNIYDSATVKPGGHADISLNQYDLVNDLNAPDTPGFVTVDNDAKTINIGSGLSSGKVDFGGVWFDTDATIGGNVNACSAGACEFGRGVRVFFKLDYEGTSDGLTFALINAAHNTTSSIGGDINAGELLGYAGDSRKVVNPTAATDFLDENGAGQDPPNPGLHPPKIALEFDTYNNNKNQAYCNADAIFDNNRSDPFSSERNRDALQFVFWGRDSLAIPCRNYTIDSTDVADHPTYDDNRHDSAEWIYDTDIWNAVRSTPALSNDGNTVYVGSDDNYFYAVDAAGGTTRWWFGTGGDVISSPVVGPDGMVYVGSQGGDGHGRVYAFNPKARLLQPTPAGGTLNTSDVYKEWVFYTPNNVNSSPAIGADGKIYIGDDQGNFYALNPADRWAASKVKSDPKEDTLTSNEWKFTNAAFNKTALGRPAVGPGPSGTSEQIYITSSENTKLFALNADSGAVQWSIDTGETTYFMPAADPDTGVIYAEIGNKIAALYPTGTSKWVAPTSIGTNRFTPVIGNDGKVYVGGLITNDTGKVTALQSTTGEIIWEFTDSGDLADVRTTPAIGLDGTIYFGSGDGLLYALNRDGSKKWTSSVAVDDDDIAGHSSPAVGDNGVVYIGSSQDDSLYAINDYTVPRNIGQNYVTAAINGMDDTVGGEPVSLDSNIDWLSGASTAGPWAVRLEVMRSLDPLDPNAVPKKYEYILNAWIRQCATDACANISGTFYEDTRIQYSAAPHLAQIIELTETEHLDFANFIFGFTGATGQSYSQSAVIMDFKLSFIRFNDPIAP